MKRSVKSSQREVVTVDVIFDGVSDANAFSGLDSLVATLDTDHGAGDYTIDLGIPLQSAVVQVTSMTANLNPEVTSITAPTGGANCKVRIKIVDNDGTPTATDAKIAISAKGSLISSVYSV
jgi:hypothetical protein